jgi:hypothetical protein
LIPKTGYVGTFIFTNVSTTEKTITIKGATLGSNYSIVNKSPINIPAKTCNIYRVYCYGFSVWDAIKVS